MRSIQEIEADIASTQHVLDSLPSSAIRLGADEDYLGRLDDLKDELAAAKKL